VSQGAPLIGGLQGQASHQVGGSSCAVARSAHVGAGGELGQLVEDAALTAGEQAQLGGWQTN
jgi:hypothetical protein